MTKQILEKIKEDIESGLNDLFENSGIRKTEYKDGDIVYTLTKTNLNTFGIKLGMSGGPVPIVILYMQGINIDSLKDRFFKKLDSRFELLNDVEKLEKKLAVEKDLYREADESVKEFEIIRDKHSKEWDQLEWMLLQRKV